MSLRTFLYALWCLAVIGGLLVSGIFAWSPFADGGRARTHTGFYGPNHK